MDKGKLLINLEEVISLSLKNDPTRVYHVIDF